MTPILFTFGSKFGNKLLFGLLDGLSLQPVRVVYDMNKVQRLGEKPPAAAGPLFVLVAAGNDCMERLEGVGLLEPILMAMASDMHQAFKKGVKPLTKAQALAQLQNGGMIW